MIYYNLPTVCPPHPQSWHDARALGLGGSDANILFGDNQEHIKNLWLEKTNQQEPEDLSEKLPVLIGKTTEALNLAYLSHSTGLEVYHDDATCSALVHSDHSFMRANLDGRIKGQNTIVEAKFTSTVSSIEDLRKNYYPQLQHNMAVAGADECYLSVIFGLHARHESLIVPRDDGYIRAMIALESEFWQCLQFGVEPSWIHHPIEVPPTEYEAMRVIDMSETNEALDFFTQAGVFTQNQQAAKDFEGAKKQLKNMLPDDARQLHYTGSPVTVTRSKGNRITIKSETKGE